MPETLAPDVRSQFAKRLKNIRTQRGFDRARYFAKSLGIEENRYTRYERAEVEPSLTLIHKMCETLHVTPNELLGFADFKDESAFDRTPGLADASVDEAARSQSGTVKRGSLAWRLASELAALRVSAAGRSKASGDPLAVFRETAAVFQKLQAAPFETVAEIVGDPALKGADAARQAELAELIGTFTEALSMPGAGRAER